MTLRLDRCTVGELRELSERCGTVIVLNRLGGSLLERRAGSSLRPIETRGKMSYCAVHRLEAKRQCHPSQKTESGPLLGPRQAQLASSFFTG